MSFTETELVAHIKNRNTKAYESLIQTYSKPVYYLAANILRSGSKEDIEECVSDVMLEVWLKIDKFDSERGNFKTWILILTKYKALEYRRKTEKSNVENIEDYLETQADELHTVERLIVSRETQERLIEAIDTFNKVDKELFIRRYFFNEKINDLMNALGLSRSAIDNRLMRGRKIIKEVMSHE